MSKFQHEDALAGVVKFHFYAGIGHRGVDFDYCVYKRQAMLAALQPGDVVVLLDERGREFTSREFSEYLDKKMIQGIKRLVFIVGGPYGFSPEMYARANEKISLSRMTFTHEMVRLFFIEQIYRAMTILRGEPYHHD